MKRLHRVSAVYIVAMSILPAISQSSLIGVLPATPGGTDYQAFYDTEADLTWLADANAAKGSGFDADVDYPTGLMDWGQANAWVTGLKINGVTGWRLPYAPDPSTDPTCEGPTPGYFNCSGSEIGNLFYNVLGGVAGESIATTHNDNYELFSNVIDIGSGYWSDLDYPPDSFYEWWSDFADGQAALIDTRILPYHTYVEHAWAVHSGNVGAVPLPAAVWLFGCGLLGLIGIAQRRMSRMSST